MRRMFASATLKLTVWYLFILVAISITFSFIIFELATSEISSRLERLQIRVEGSSETLVLPGPLTLNDVRVNQTQEARASIFIGLVYLNVAVITVGGIGSYSLARRTLRPIESAHESQSRFTSDASHELRTPLAVMKSEIQVALRDTHATKNDLREVLESNLEEVDKLTLLSHSLLQLSRLDFATFTHDDEIDIVAAVKDEAKSIGVPQERLSFDVPDAPLNTKGNAATLHDLIRILLDNAVKYSPPDSPITFKLTSNYRTYRFSFANEGEGIERDELKHIFDRFYRTDTSRSRHDKPSGYGIGLALAKRITELHGGTITANSAPGKLTKFTVTLPLS